MPDQGSAPDAMSGAMRYSIFSVQDHHPDLPRTISQFYGEMLEQAVLAERLGFDTYFAAEHHFHPYGVFPNPAVALAAVAALTERIRLGVAVSVLPFRNPLMVAEDYAMLDQLSGGRVVLGVGSGYLKHEFEAFGVDPATKREHFDEALEIVLRAMTGAPVTVDSRFHKFDNVALNITSVQQPHPPVYVAVLRREAARFVGLNGHCLMSVPYASVDRFDEVGPMAEEYRAGFAESGADAGGRDELFAFHAHIAESDAAAEREAAEAFDLYVATRLYAKSHVYADVMESGLSLIGAPATVADKLVALHGMGLRHIMLLNNFGALDHRLVCASMERFAAEVAPAVARRLAQPASA